MARLVNQIIHVGVKQFDAVVKDGITNVWKTATKPLMPTGIYEGNNIVVTNGSEVQPITKLSVLAKCVPVTDGIVSHPLLVTGTFDTITDTILKVSGVAPAVPTETHKDRLRILFQNKKEVS